MLSGNPTSSVTLTLNTANGTASPATTADGNYSAITNQVRTFIIEDTIVELNEQFFLTATVTDTCTVSNNGGAATGAGTIQIDDSAAFTLNNVTVNENDGTANFTLSLSNPIDIPIRAIAF